MPAILRRSPLAALLAAVLAACASARVEEQPRVVLADSVAYGDGMTWGHLHRFVVVHGGRRDTVPGVLVADPPVVGPDGAVYGIQARDELAVGLFAYDVAARRIRALPTPERWWESTSPRLAPDGRHVAYLGYGTDGTGHAAVAALPDGRVIYRGPSAVLLETGAGVDVIRWITPAEFDIRVYMGGATGGIQRVRGSVAPLRVRVDTLPDDWE